MNIAKHLLLTLTLVVVVLPLSAQGRAETDTPLPSSVTDRDTIYTFRFMTGRDKDKFYTPWGGNGAVLARLLACVETHRQIIINGSSLYVDGYCDSEASREASLALARIRSNRVKSELIIRKGLREEHFITRNHFAAGNCVTVRLVLPKEMTSAADDGQPRRQEEVATIPTGSDRTTGQPDDTEAVPLPLEQEQKPVQEPETLLPTLPKRSCLSLRANLLRWVTLTPDLGVEWRMSERWSLQLNGTWTSWSWDDKNRRYALWEISPEVRCHLGESKRAYVGVMCHGGHFNYKFSETGRQGDLMGGGLTGGYLLRMGRNFSLDLTIGVGCSHADFDKYRVIDGVRVWSGKESKNHWGVNRLGVTLVYHLKQGGTGR